VTGTNVWITDSVIYNDDDAIAVQSGSHNVVFERNTVGYQSHGMRIGSLGEDQSEYANVSNIQVLDGLTGYREKHHLEEHSCL
jgi:polygalacturonase